MWQLIIMYCIDYFTDRYVSYVVGSTVIAEY